MHNYFINIIAAVLTCFATTVVCAQYHAQHYTEFVFTGTAPANVLRAMQNNAEAVFSQIHQAHFLRSPSITLSSNNATPEAMDRLQALWKTNKFYCIEYDLIAQVSQTPRGYQVRNIPVLFVDEVTYEDIRRNRILGFKPEYLVLEFTLDGKISNIYNANTEFDGNANITNPNPTPDPTPIPSPPTPSSVNKTLLLQLVNQHRASGYTCGDTYYGPTTPVEWNDNLELAAYDHSLDMYTNNYFSHTGQDGSRPWDRAQRRNYGSTYVGENIFRGLNTEEAAIREWMNSPGHCRNIMNPNFTEMGVGHVNSYWTMKLGRR